MSQWGILLEGGAIIFFVAVLFTYGAAGLKWLRLTPALRKRYRKLPKGSLGWPLVGETFAFQHCLMSTTPHSFVDERRRRSSNLHTNNACDRMIFFAHNALCLRSSLDLCSWIEAQYSRPDFWLDGGQVIQQIRSVILSSFRRTQHKFFVFQIFWWSSFSSFYLLACLGTFNSLKLNNPIQPSFSGSIDFCWKLPSFRIAADNHPLSTCRNQSSHDCWMLIFFLLIYHLWSIRDMLIFVSTRGKRTWHIQIRKCSEK